MWVVCNATTPSTRPTRKMIIQTVSTLTSAWGSIKMSNHLHVRVDFMPVSGKLKILNQIALSLFPDRMLVNLLRSKGLRITMTTISVFKLNIGAHRAKITLWFTCTVTVPWHRYSGAAIISSILIMIKRTTKCRWTQSRGAKWSKQIVSGLSSDLWFTFSELWVSSVG